MVKAIEQPAITVLLPVYNAESFLEEAIESILGQTFEDFEFLIIDDGSTDGSLGIINKYAEKDSRIRVTSRSNKGFVATLEEGLLLASSNLVARMDADDIALPTRLEVQYQYLQKHPDCSVVGCQVQVIDEDGERKQVDPRPTQDMNLKLFLAYGCALSGPTVIFRKDIIQSIGGFRQAALPAEDYDCWVRLVEQRPETKIANIPDVLYLYRENSNGISLSNKVAQIQKTIDIGNEFRHAMIQKKRKFLAESVHVGYLKDLAHIKDPREREQLMQIYYRVQLWFRNDVAKTNKTLAYLMKLKLMIYTKRHNPESVSYVSNQPVAHTFPDK